jgi:hypothetical protein
MAAIAAAFFCTGVLTTTVAQLVVYAGAGNQIAGLLVFATFLGMVSLYHVCRLRPGGQQPPALSRAELCWATPKAGGCIFSRPPKSN